jgi:hypothetical protein
MNGTSHNIGNLKVTDNIYTDGTCKFVPGSSAIRGASDGSGIAIAVTDTPSAVVTASELRNDKAAACYFRHREWGRLSRTVQ